MVAAWGAVLIMGVTDPLGGINTLWPLFGIGNQMLAAMALLLGTAVLFKMKKERYAWVTVVPTVFLLITLFTTAVATMLFAGVQPQYDNAWLEYGQLGLFALLSAWVVTGFTTALMGFYVALRGDKRSISVREVQGKAMPTDARTAIIMPMTPITIMTTSRVRRAP